MYDIQMKYILIFLILTSKTMAATSQMKPLIANEMTIAADLKGILNQSHFSEDLIDFTVKKSDTNTVTINCSEGRINLAVNAVPVEWSATFYYGLQKLGFLFPHPRITITPKKSDMLKHCGKTYFFNPAFKYRGFHLHTLHPSEWVHGFLMGKKKMALDFIKWLARNSQNTFDISLLRQEKAEIYKNLKDPFQKAKEFAIYPGIALGMSLHQQNSFKILSLFSSLTGLNAEKNIKEVVNDLIKNIDFSFLNLESGTSEFTSVSYDDNIKWMNLVSDLLKPHQRQLLTKVHVSTNQKNKKYGNFNFLPQYAKKEVGILPHTVMFYDLYEENAPMYGNKNFHHMRDFLLKEKEKRPTWYYPETSYYILMDIDIPLLLTDYLVSRARDMKNLSAENLEGHLNFTTGQELGYWLFDWTVALHNNRDYDFDPLIALKLLGEDEAKWKLLLDFQTKYFKDHQLISELSFPNMQDEISSEHRIHTRTNLDEYLDNPKKLHTVIETMTKAWNEVPSTEFIKNEELKILMDITHARLHHALQTRMGLRHPKDSHLRTQQIEKAKLTRMKAQALMDRYLQKYKRYPLAKIFERNQNPTSYQFGYGFTASNLHLWHREEEQALQENWSPFFMQVMDVWDILF